MIFGLAIKNRGLRSPSACTQAGILRKAAIPCLIDAERQEAAAAPAVMNVCRYGMVIIARTVHLAEMLLFIPLG
jgi:hypothetical protein